MTTLTRASFEKRHAELEEAERLAEDALKQAAFAETTGTGSADETAKARKHRDAIREQRETLRLAFDESEKHAGEKRDKARAKAYADLQSEIDDQLAERRHLVATIIELADNLGKALIEHDAIRDRINRKVNAYNKEFGVNRGLGALDGFQRALNFGHTMGVLVGHQLDLHGIHSMTISGDRNSMRGEDPLAIETRAADAVKAQVEMLAPKGDA